MNIQNLTTWLVYYDLGHIRTTYTVLPSTSWLQLDSFQHDPKKSSATNYGYLSTIHSHFIFPILVMFCELWPRNFPLSILCHLPVLDWAQNMKFRNFCVRIVVILFVKYPYRKHRSREPLMSTFQPIRERVLKYGTPSINQSLSISFLIFDLKWRVYA